VAVDGKSDRYHGPLNTIYELTTRNLQPFADPDQFFSLEKFVHIPIFSIKLIR
jgi:hypothetical protein